MKNDQIEAYLRSLNGGSDVETLAQKDAWKYENTFVKGQYSLQQFVDCT